MEEITASANADSKSSAGDKHETTRAMMQLEQEKLGKQVMEAVDQITEFDKIDFTKTSTTVTQSSLVETDKGYFFIAGSIGKITVRDTTVFVISAKSPLALALAGAQPNTSVTFNGVLYHIKSIA